MAIENVQPLPSLSDLIDGNGEQPKATPVVEPAKPDDVIVDDPAKQPDPPKPDDKPAPDEGGDDSSGDDDQELTPDDFLKQVDTLRGTELYSTIDYGGVDPMSPEGFVIRDKAVWAASANALEEQISQSDPRAYAYLLHRQNGGDDESFFAVKSFVLPELDKLKESVDLQRTVLTESLKSRGVGDKQVAAVIKASIEAGELAADAETAYKEIRKADEKVASDAAKAHETRIKQEKADIATLDSAVNEVISVGKDLRFQIPDSEKGKFAQAFKENVHYENGKFFYIKPISKEALPKILETELFAYLGGDIGKMVQKEAQTINAMRFMKKAKAGDDSSKKSAANNGTSTKTLGEL